MKTLIRILIFSLLISFLLPIFPAKAENELEKGPVWLSAGGQKSSDLSNQSQAKTVSDNTLDVVIKYPGFWADVQNENGADFTKLWHEEYGSYREPGQPALPGKTVNILIPNGAQVEVLSQTVTSEKFRLSDYGLPTTIIPAQIQVSKSEPPPPWTQPDPKHYGNQNVFPQNWYELKDTFQMRDYTILPIWINPVRYSPGKGELEILEQIELRLTWQTSSLDRTKRVVVSDSPSFDRLVSQIVVNPPELPVYDTKEGTGEGYLIIAPDIFYDELEPFIEMKVEQGFAVQTTKLSEIVGFDGPDDGENDDIEAIQNYIRSLEPTPVYLLLVGDTNFIPGFNKTNYNYDFASNFDKTSDLYFGTMDDDFIPDIAVGRLPARTLNDLAIILNKIKSYNDLGFQNWHTQTSFISSCDNYTVPEGSHDHVISNFTRPLNYPTNFPTSNLSPGGDKLYCKTYEAREINMIESINNKRGIITYSGHGNVTSWTELSTSLYNITSGDLEFLSENNAYSFVSSFACFTNDFGNSTIDTVFGETWMLLENKGAIAFLGSSDETIWNPDDLFERKLFEILFTDPYNPPSLKLAIIEALKFNNYPISGVGTEQYYFETYNLLGDPSQKLWLVPNNRVFMPVIYK